jgi:tyrosyl-tRNA synthetase
MAEIDLMKQEVAAGRNPKDCKVLLAQEIVARFHSQAAAEKALEDFNHRAKGGVPDDISEASLTGAPMGVANLLKAAGLTPSTSEANRNIDQNGVKIDGVTITDKQLKIDAGTYVVQVGKRKFAKVTLS